MHKRYKLPPQIIRLVLLTVGIVGSYLVARTLLTPASFGQYGWDRGDALTELASRPRSFAGRSACTECHSDQAAKLTQFSHRNLSCEVCHGPGAAHVEDFDNKLATLTHSHCLRCHETNPSRPKTHKQIKSREHYPGDKCVDCHLPHAPTEVP